MPIVLSDGQEFEDDFSLLYSMSSRTPLGSPEKPAGEFKSQPGREVAPQNNNAPGPSQSVVDKLLGNNGPRYQLWPEKMVRSLYSAVKAPGEVMSGDLPTWSQDENGDFHTSPAVIEKMNDLADLAVLGPMPLAGKLVDGTLGSFAGVKAKTADKAKLREAQTILEEGGTVDDMFAKTGWFVGADNKAKFEISDANSKLKLEAFKAIEEKPSWTSVGNTEGQAYVLPEVKLLKDIYDHPELFAAYPHLGDIQMMRVPQGANYGGIYRRGENGNPDIIELPKGSENDIHTTLVHEIQHAIQTYEGFGKGGAPALNTPLRWDKQIDAFDLEYRQIWDRYIKEGSMSPKDKDRMDYLAQVLSLDERRRAAANDQAKANYNKLSGEVEARNVEERLALGKFMKEQGKNPEDLKYIHPDRTADVPRNKQETFYEPQWATPYGYGNPDIPPAY